MNFNLINVNNLTRKQNIILRRMLQELERRCEETIKKHVDKLPDKKRMAVVFSMCFDESQKAISGLPFNQWPDDMPDLVRSSIKDDENILFEWISDKVILSLKEKYPNLVCGSSDNIKAFCMDAVVESAAALNRLYELLSS